MSTERDGHPVDRLPDLLLGELPAPEAERVLDHVSGCPGCRAAWQDLQSTGEALADAAPDGNVPPAGRGLVMARVAADSRRRRLRRRLAPLAAVLVGAVAASALWFPFASGLMGSPMPGQRMAVLGGPHGMGGDVYMDTALHRVTVQVWRLPRLPRGQVYEVWWTHGTSHTMGGSFGVDTNGDAMVTLAMPAHWTVQRTIVITMEPAPGTSRPTGTWLVTGTLKASTSSA